MSIEAMKQALAALEQVKPLYDKHHAIVALRQAIEQAEKQEPVAWHHPDCEGECIACLIEREVESQYGTQGLAYLRRHLYTTPQPHREWVGLTDEELSQFDVDPIEAKLMIAKLKEKNP